MPGFTVYIVRCSDNALYTGRTENIGWRLARHLDGTACDFTRRRRPVTLVWSEPHDSYDSATRRERQIKGWSRAKKEALISGDTARLRALSRCRGLHGPAA